MTILINVDKVIDETLANQLKHQLENITGVIEVIIYSNSVTVQIPINTGKEAYNEVAEILANLEQFQNNNNDN